MQAHLMAPANRAPAHSRAREQAAGLNRLPAFGPTASGRRLERCPVGATRGREAEDSKEENRMHRPPSYTRLANAVKEFPARASSTCASAWRATLRFDGARRPP